MKKVAAIAGKLSRKLSSFPGEDKMGVRWQLWGSTVRTNLIWLLKDSEMSESQQAVTRVMKGESVNATVSVRLLCSPYVCLSIHLTVCVSLQCSFWCDG